MPAARTDKADEILQLLAEGVTQCEIARRCGVARSTVQLYRHQVSAAPSAPQLHYPRSDGANFRRCPECGGLVLLPCFLCQLRGVMRAGGEIVDGAGMIRRASAGAS